MKTKSYEPPGQTTAYKTRNLVCTSHMNDEQNKYCILSLTLYLNIL